MKLLKSNPEGKIRTKGRGEKATVRKNKMLVLRKRQVAAASLILLIGIAGYLNMTIKDGAEDPNISVMYHEAAKRLGEAKMVNSTDAQEEQPEEKITNNEMTVDSNYFVNAKMEREKTRAETVETLKAVLNSKEADKESKQNAQNRIELLSRFTEAEIAAENMIKAKGYGECVVFMGENATSVAVETNGLNEIDAAVIMELVSSGGVVSANQVKIIEIKPN